jgi:hypothetical protein
MLPIQERIHERYAGRRSSIENTGRPIRGKRIENIGN